MLTETPEGQRSVRESFVRIGRRIENAFWDLSIGIRTNGLLFPEESSDEHLHYGTQPYRETIAVLKSLHLHESDVFVDLGSGKGRILCLAGRFPLKEVIGVESVALLSELARNNVARMRGRRSPITVRVEGAQDFDFTQGTVYYMFHPFGPRTLREVLTGMREGLLRNPRGIRIVYANPVHESVMAEMTWLERYDHWTKHSHRQVLEAVSFWRSVL